jgi:hypothetical protein
MTRQTRKISYPTFVIGFLFLCLTYNKYVFYFYYLEVVFGFQLVENGGVQFWP